MNVRKLECKAGMESGVSSLESKICYLPLFFIFFSNDIPFRTIWNSSKVNFNQMREK